MICTKWLIGGLGLAILIGAGYTWLNKNNNMITLTPTKAVFNNEPATLTLTNQSQASIYVLPTLYDGLSVAGRVEQKDGSDYFSIKTHNDAESFTSTREYQKPEPEEVRIGESVEVILTGVATGVYRVSAAYKKEIGPWNPIRESVTSPDFEIKQ